MTRVRQKNSLNKWLALALIVAAVALSPLANLFATPQPAASQRYLPYALSDETFWNLVTSFSETGGHFPSDNFTSNEPLYPQIIESLLAGGNQGGAYLGVGPEQNFHYIAALRPAIAFQLDIRRQAIAQHLMYKAIFELSPDRAGFISLLFSRTRPSGLDSSSSIKEIWGAGWTVAGDSATRDRNFALIVDRLTKSHGFTMSGDDLALMDYVYRAFHKLGPGISYGGYEARDASLSFAALTSAGDSAAPARSFLATEESYRYVRDMQLRNLVIPVVGDFAGPKAIRSVAGFLRDHDTRVNAFYVSNVESYLFRDGLARRFYASVAELPLDSASVFIRPSGVAGSRARIVAMHGVIRPDSATLPAPPGVALCPIQAFIKTHASAGVTSYEDALDCLR